MITEDVSRMPWDQRIARQLVRPLAHTPMTPNHLTTVSLGIGIGGAVLFALGGKAVHWGALCFILSALLDHADGELARMTGRATASGHVYDNIAGGIVHFAVFLGIGLGLRDSSLGPWAIPMAVVTGAAVAFLFTYRLQVERRLGRAAVDQPRWAGFEIEDCMYLIGPVTWVGGLVPFFIAAAIGAPLFALWQLWDIWRSAPAGQGQQQSETRR